LEITKTVGYKHFCQTPHCQHERCNICPFSSNAEEGDARASREAGLKVIENLESIAPPGEALAKVAVKLLRLYLQLLPLEREREQGRKRLQLLVHEFFSVIFQAHARTTKWVKSSLVSFLSTCIRCKL
jgi:hypothetical protein